MGATTEQAGGEGDEVAAGFGPGPVPQAGGRGHVLDLRQGDVRHGRRIWT